MDTVDFVLRLLKEEELEKLKTSLVQVLLQRKVFHRFRFFSKYFLVAFFQRCQEYDWKWIVTFKDGNLPSVWEEIEPLKKLSPNNHRKEEFSLQGNPVLQEYCWVNQIDYCGYSVNWVEC